MILSYLTYYSPLSLSLPYLSPGMRGNLQENELYVGANLGLTMATVLLSVYFLAWQSYVLRADVIINTVLLIVYGLGGVLAFITLARFTRSDLSSVTTSYQNHISSTIDGEV